LRIIFWGTASFGLPALESLWQSGHEILAVVTQPDRPQGRGKKIIPSPVKSWAIPKKIPVYQPEKIQDHAFVNFLKSLAPEIMVVIAYGQILSLDILAIPPRGCLNVHASILPKYRGAAPIPWAILQGETRTGVTTMFMDEGMDTGPILLIGETDIALEENAGELHDRLAKMGADLLLQTLAGLEAGWLKPQPQDHAQATYAPKITKEMARINWQMSARQLFNHLRAFDPWPGAFTNLNRRLLKMFRPRFFSGMEEINAEPPGTIVQATNEEITIATGRGYLKVREVQLENRPRMKVAEFLHGHQLVPGMRLGE
jgi:methionyl-tRNA formyltransferase